MSAEDEIELRDRMILILVKKIHSDPETQQRLIGVIEAQATEEMSKSLFLVNSASRDGL